MSLAVADVAVGVHRAARRAGGVVGVPLRLRNGRVALEEPARSGCGRIAGIVAAASVAAAVGRRRVIAAQTGEAARCHIAQLRVAGRRSRRSRGRVVARRRRRVRQVRTGLIGVIGARCVQLIRRGLSQAGETGPAVVIIRLIGLELIGVGRVLGLVAVKGVLRLRLAVPEIRIRNVEVVLEVLLVGVFRVDDVLLLLPLTVLKVLLERSLCPLVGGVVSRPGVPLRVVVDGLGGIARRERWPPARPGAPAAPG